MKARCETFPLVILARETVILSVASVVLTWAWYLFRHEFYLTQTCFTKIYRSRVESLQAVAAPIRHSHYAALTLPDFLTMWLECCRYSDSTTGWTTVETFFDSVEGQEIFLFFKLSRPALWDPCGLLDGCWDLSVRTYSWRFSCHMEIVRIKFMTPPLINFRGIYSRFCIFSYSKNSSDLILVLFL